MVLKQLQLKLLNLGAILKSLLVALPGKVLLDESCPVVFSWVTWKEGPQRSGLVGVIEEL